MKHSLSILAILFSLITYAHDLNPQLNTTTDCDDDDDVYFCTCGGTVGNKKNMGSEVLIRHDIIGNTKFETVIQVYDATILCRAALPEHPSCMQ